jgi:hypothetical protein
LLVCCVLSGRGLCDELITRPEESYQLSFIGVCDQETSWTRRPQPTLGCKARENNNDICMYVSMCVCMYEHTHQLSQRSHYWVIIMLQGKTTLFMDQCSGDMQYALKMVENNLNNLCTFSLSISNSELEYSEYSVHLVGPELNKHVPIVTL